SGTGNDAHVPGGALRIWLKGGVGAAECSIDSGGVLSFNSAPDYETPTDVGADNIYNLTVRADDGNGSTTDQSIAVTVTPVNDNAPQFTSNATIDVAGNTTTVGTVTATDADLPAQTVSFSLNGGVDAAKFSITSGGVLSFIRPPDY